MDLPTYNDGECVQGMYCDCNLQSDGPLRAIPSAVLQDEDIEVETRSCGWPIENNIGLNIAYIWQRVYDDCQPSPCSNGGQLVASNWASGPIPKKIIGISNNPKYLLGNLYSSAATIRFRRQGPSAAGESRFVCDLTASTSDGLGTPTVTAADCRYYHRMGSDGSCDVVSGNSQCQRQAGGYYNYGYGSELANAPSVMCAPDACCCKAELRIRFRVVMDYQEMYWASPSSLYGVKPSSAGSWTMIVTAYYYGCTDSRLYNATSTQPALRNFTLDRASFTFPSVDIDPDRYGLGDVPGYSSTPYIYTSPCGAGGTASQSFVTTDDGCTTCFSQSSTFDATTAIAMGVPASVSVTRSTP